MEAPIHGKVWYVESKFLIESVYGVWDTGSKLIYGMIPESQLAQWRRFTLQETILLNKVSDIINPSTGTWDDVWAFLECLCK
jgi:hypothetical protein